MVKILHERNAKHDSFDTNLLLEIRKTCHFIV